MMAWILRLGFAVALVGSSWCWAVDYVFTKANNKVEWVAVGTPGFLRINGTGGAAEGTLKADGGKVSGTLEVALTPYQTGIETRDKHMHEKYLQTGKFPKAKLVLANVPFKNGTEFPWEGDLTIKNTTKRVKGTGTVRGKKVVAGFKVQVKDYPAIGVPTYLGITMADEVEVTVEGTL